MPQALGSCSLFGVWITPLPADLGKTGPSFTSQMARFPKGFSLPKLLVLPSSVPETKPVSPDVSPGLILQGSLSHWCHDKDCSIPVHLISQNFKGLGICETTFKFG